MSCDLSCLPVNVLTQICHYLNFKDVCNCSRVSVAWREAFNNEEIWSWFYDKHFASRIGNNCSSNFILDSCSFVEPFLSLPTNESYRMSALCESRLHCMLQNLLDCNWSTGNFVAFKFRKGFAGEFGHIECQENLLLDQNPYRGNSFTVWDITGKPIELGSITYSIDHHSHATYFKFTESYVTVVQYNLLQIYQKQNMWPMFRLKFRRLFDRPEEESQSIPNQEDITEWYNEYFLRQYMQNYRFCFCANANYFAGSFYDRTPTIHVWDVESGSKQNEIVVPQPKGNVCKCILVMNVKYLFITLRIFHDSNTKNSTLIHSYDLKNEILTNLKLYFHAVDNVLFKNDFIISIDEKKFKIDIYDNEYGQKLYSIKEQVDLFPQTVDIVHNFVYYAVGKRENDACSDFEVKIKKLEKSAVTNFFHHTVKNLSNIYIYFIRQRFLLVSNWFNNYSKTSVIDTWNDQKESASFDIENARAHCFEHHDSKILVQMADLSFRILHFY
ncbi:unnamed protein product [Bemisia tabaci]|uniref:F-box domain-containing protein n=1 Tax=Bemisia tabaci TaxID=7038 RepID=A0A9P0C793_BEMTA|nr:unnamed protein product [Bemisia tabaci]